MIKKIVSAIAVILFSHCVTASDTSDGTVRSFYPDNHFSIEFPIDWQLIKGEEEVVIVAVAPSGDILHGSRNSVIISSAYKENYAYNQKQRFATYLNSIEQFDGECKVLDTGELITEYNEKMIWVIYTQQREKFFSKNMTFVFVKEDYQYIIGCYTEASTFEQYKLLFNQIAASFQFEK